MLRALMLVLSAIIVLVGMRRRRWYCRVQVAQLRPVPTASVWAMHRGAAWKTEG